jgi:antitoxin (DNA-binding transcriptional repressor) of toxin-antitoxin stability system
MKFLSVRELRGKSAGVWAALPAEREMVVTSNGRPVAILSSVREDEVEESLAAIRQARAATAVARLQANSAACGLDRLTPAEIQAEIDAVRRDRAR